MEKTVDLVLVLGDGVSNPCMRLLVLAEEGFLTLTFLLDVMIGDEGDDGSAVFDGVRWRSS